MRRVQPLVPGLVLVVLGVALAEALHALVGGLAAATAAVVIGAVAGTAGLADGPRAAGVRWAGRTLLRAGVVLLGFSLSLSSIVHIGGPGLLVVLVTVAVTFGGTLALARSLRLTPGQGLLTATGFSICGASAVAAMEPYADATDEDAGVAVALVTLCGTLAILLLPALRGPLGLHDVTTFGRWVGASVHDVGQTVATAARVPGALQPAIVVKLTRVVLLAPMVALVAARRRRTRPTQEGTRPPLVPVFVIAFVLAAVVRTTGVLPAGALSAAHTAQQLLLEAGLVGLGTGIRPRVLRATGPRVLVLGAGSWLLVGAVAWAGVRLTA